MGIHRAVQIHVAGDIQKAGCSLQTREPIDIDNVVEQVQIQRYRMDIMSRQSALRNLSHHVQVRIGQCPSQIDGAAQFARKRYLPLVHQRAKPADLRIRDSDRAVDGLRIRMENTFQPIGALSLQETELLQIKIAVVILELSMHISDADPIQDQLRRIQNPGKSRLVHRPSDGSVKGADPGGLVGQLALEPLHIDLLGRDLHIQRQGLTIQDAVQIHVHHGREDVEVLQPQVIPLHEIIAVHAGNQHAVVASAREVDIAHDMRLVQRAGDRDDIIHIARELLPGSCKCHDVLHSGSHGVDPQADFFLADKTDRSLHLPYILSVPLHLEIINTYAIQAAGELSKGCLNKVPCSAENLISTCGFDSTPLTLP